MTLLDEMEQLYAPPDHPVFQLVPLAFREHAETFYLRLGRPVVNFASFWRIYSQLLHEFKQHRTNEPGSGLEEVLTNHKEYSQRIEGGDDVPLLQGLKELRNGGNVIGSVAGAASSSVAFVEPEEAEFTDSDLDSGEE
jgi:hypothetical protein